MPDRSKVRRHRHGFTLFEVAISTLIVVVVVLATVMSLPLGIRLQQEARHGLHAAAITLTLLDAAHHPAPVLDSARPRARIGTPTRDGLLAAGVYGSAFAPDIERLASQLKLAIPLPSDIARRLDSDDDAIRRHLDAGGRLFYLDPTGVPYLNESASFPGFVPIDDPSARQELVFAVLGAPQQNALFATPWDDQPRYAQYPFPPSAVRPPACASNARTDFGDEATPNFTGRSRVLQLVPLGTYAAGDPPAGLYAGTGGYRARLSDGSDRNRLVPFHMGHGWKLSNHNNAERGAPWLGRNWIWSALSAPAGAEGWPWNDAFVLNRLVDLGADVRTGWLPIVAVLHPFAWQMRQVDNRFSPSWIDAPELTYYQLLGDRLPLPSYVLRASYRDRAIALWQALRPVGTYDFGAPHAEYGALLQSDDPGADDLRLDCDRFAYAPEQLRSFVATDPLALDARDFPPHPARVQALSHLAHAAMMVAGMVPPFEQLPLVEKLPPEKGEAAGAFGDLDSLIYLDALSSESVDPYDLVAQAPDQPRSSDDPAEESWLKDTLRAKGVSASEMRLYADGYTDALVYAGEYLWSPSAPSLVHRVATTVRVAPATVGGTSSAALHFDASIPVLGRDAGFRYGLPIAPAVPIADGILIRVANADDLDFAARVHEMCLEWAMAYAREAPMDWGAPKPINRPLSFDRIPLLSDIFAADGTAARPDGAGFNRFVAPFNPVAARAPRSLRMPLDSSDQAQFSHVGIADTRQPSEWSPIRDATAAGQALGEPAAGLDRERYWLPRSFDPRDRGRELVFWSVRWRDYADADSAPSAAEDFSRLGLVPGLAPGSRVRTNDGLPYWYGTADQWLLWRDEERHNRNNGPWTVHYDASSADSSDRHLQVLLNRSLTPVDVHPQLMGQLTGVWGADRNHGRSQGSEGMVAPAQRLRAREVARFTVYDPVLRLQARN